MSATIISFDNRATRESDRLKAIQSGRSALDDLAADLGSPEEWLATAINHLKAETSDRRQRDGIAVVSVAALNLVLIHLEAVECRGRPWSGNAA